MPSEVLFHSLNIGVVDKDKLHRVDLERMRLASEIQTNIMSDAVGKGWLRAGFEHIALTASGNKARLIPFVPGSAQVYALELSANAMRIFDNIASALVERPAVVAPITSGDFNAAAGWTLGAAAGTTCVIAGGALKLQAFGRGSRAYARQQVNTANSNVEHALRITIYRGPVRFRVGAVVGGQEYIKETVLRTGYHSLAFIPTGASFWVEFSTQTIKPVYVNDIQVEAAGIVSLPTIWDVDDLDYIRYDQSLDVLFLACEGRKQQRIETRGNKSFSVCDFDSDDGPFSVGSDEMTMRPTALEGEAQLYSSLPYFTADHLGAMFRIYHNGQKIQTTVAAADTFTPSIFVTGINEPDYNERDWKYTITGTWVGTLQVQRSFDGDDVEFHNFRIAQGVATMGITANVANVTNDDNEDNAIAYYRIGFETGAYTSGAATISMTYQGGGGFGICRVVNVVGPSIVDIEILKPFYDTAYSKEWREGAWSENVGWPTSVAIDDGRLNWAGYDGFWASVSDAYESFDEDFAGDSGPLLRSIAVGGRNEARWLAGLSNLMVGTDSLIAAVRASTLDEIKTPDNFGIRKLTSVGAARVNPAVLADDRALFVEAAGTALYELNYDSTKGKFFATEFSKLTTEPFETGITGMCVQNRPDQRIWITTEDSDAVCIVFEPAQEVVGYIPISTSWATDFIESMIVLPSNGQDRVIASIRRVVNGVTSRRIERLALDSDAKPQTITKCLDAFKVFGPGSATINVPHLIGRTVRVWMDGDSVDDADGVAIDFTVDVSGNITLPSVPVTGGCVGIPYQGRYKSGRLEYGNGSTSMLKNKTVAGLGLMLGDYCRSGVKYGYEFDNADHPLMNLPLSRNGVPVTSDVVVGPDVDEPIHEMGGTISFDTRVCIELQSPKPCTILSMVLSIENYGG